MKEEKDRNKKRNWYNTDKDWRDRFCRRGCAVILGVKKKRERDWTGSVWFLRAK